MLTKNEVMHCCRCSKQLPISANYNRKYCNVCQRVRQSEWHKNKYLAKKKAGIITVGKKKICRVCRDEFVYKQSVGRSRDICPNCVDKYIDKVNNLTCLLCGKKIEQTGVAIGKRIRFAFCSVECSKPAWYVLRRHKRMMIK